VLPQGAVRIAGHHGNQIEVRETGNQVLRGQATVGVDRGPPAPAAEIDRGGAGKQHVESDADRAKGAAAQPDEEAADQ
jgi:hypothetical protein